ncbi:hypothetical protein WDW37_14750 [Bdellovibrionota bacterium FG-1]
MTPKHQIHWAHAFAASIILATGCGKAPIAAVTPIAAGKVSLLAAPLAGASAASLTSGLLEFLLGERVAYAAVSSFGALKICNDTLVLTDTHGNTVAVNGSTNQAGLGLLSFSSASTSNTTLANLDVAAGTQIKEIDITSAISATLCPGFSYAVQFDPGSGPINITQNTAFKFTFSTPVTITGSAQNLTLLLGQIVNGMVALGAGLSNSTIQTVSAGQAQ